MQKTDLWIELFASVWLDLCYRIVVKQQINECAAMNEAADQQANFSSLQRPAPDCVHDYKTEKLSTLRPASQVPEQPDTLIDNQAKRCFQFAKWQQK